MGLIDGVFSLLFGGGRNVLRETAEVFRENAEAGAERQSDMQGQTLEQFAAEFAQRPRGAFDRFMDGVNRVPRPALALGTLGLLLTAMIEPLWFAERMQGLALVPEPMWWLLGVIVSFYFGARHQVKHQTFQKEIAATLSRTPQVVDNIRALRALEADSPKAADTGSDAELSLAALHPGNNQALADWRKTRA